VLGVGPAQGVEEPVGRPKRVLWINAAAKQGGDPQVNDSP